MAKKIGVQALLDAADFVGGLMDYMQGLDKAEKKTDDFARTAEGPVTAKLSAFSQIAIGALRKIGEAAVEFAGRAIQALANLTRQMVAGALDAENVETRLGIVITAMGDATDLTIDQANEMAEANRDLFRGNDEVARSVIQVGLSMGTVSADQMPTFLRQVADLAAVTGTDAPTAARLFAQAYEDPISTLRRFRQQNIMVDDATQETIKNLVEQGDTAGAAALLMEQVAMRTAGAAETMADTTEGRLAIFREHLADIREGIAGRFLGALDEPLQELSPMIEEAFGGLADWLTRPEVVQGFQDLLIGAVDLFEAIREGPDENSPFMQFLRRMGDWWATNGPGITQTAQTLFGRMRETIDQVVTKIRPFVERVLVQLADWFEENGPLIQQVAKQIGDRLANVFQAIGDAWAWIEPILQGLVDLILGLATAVMEAFTGNWEGAWQTVKDTVAQVWEGIKEAIAAFADWVAGWFGTTWQGIKDQWSQNWEDFKLIVTTLWDRIKEGIAEKAEEIATAIRDWVTGLRDNIVERVQAFVQAGKDLITGLWNGIRERVQWLKDRIREGMQSVIDLVRRLFGSGSPSRVFMEIGGELMLGMARGIQRTVPMAAGQMQYAAAAVTAPALSQISVNRSRTTNVNMDFDANYAEWQSPVRVRDDVAALLATVRR